MRHSRPPSLIDGLILAALALLAGALFRDRPASALSCPVPNVMLLELAGVTEDGVPATGNYDARVTLYSRENGVMTVYADPNASKTSCEAGPGGA